MMGAGGTLTGAVWSVDKPSSAGHVLPQCLCSSALVYMTRLSSAGQSVKQLSSASHSLTETPSNSNRQRFVVLGS